MTMLGCIIETFLTNVILYANLAFARKLGICITLSLLVVCKDAKPANSNFLNFTSKVEYSELMFKVPEYCSGFAFVPK